MSDRPIGCTPLKASIWCSSINFSKDTDQNDVFGVWHLFNFSRSLSHFGDEWELFLAFFFIVQLKPHHKMSGHGFLHCCFWLSITYWSLSHHLLYITPKRNTCCHVKPYVSLSFNIHSVWLRKPLSNFENLLLFFWWLTKCVSTLIVHLFFGWQLLVNNALI